MSIHSFLRIYGHHRDYVVGNINQTIKLRLMRPRVPWMTETDDAILEFLREVKVDGAPVALPATAVWLNLREMDLLERAPNTISSRFGQLSKVGLVECIDEKRGYYRITDKGIAYLEGELEYDDLVLPEDS